MTRNLGTLWLPALAAAALAGAGCASSRYEEERSAVRHIEAARDAQADPDAIAVADKAVRYAREIEAAADAEESAAQEDVEAAELWRNQATTRRTALTARLDDAEARLIAARRGGPKERVQSLERGRDTVKKELALADMEIRHATGAVKGATERKLNAGERLKLAQALYSQAEQQAKTAEIEALSASRAAVDAKLAGEKQ